jgi:hypothetical protein
VKVWSYSDGEHSDTADCGSVTVTDSTPTPTPTPTPSAAAQCTVSETNVRVGESVTLDASDSENADDYQYDKYGGSSFGEFTAQSSRTVSYGEPSTYDPRVKVWSYSDGEHSDVADCGTVTVTDSTPTPTPTADATCSVSATSVQVGESVTLDASDSANADDYQYDESGEGSFGELTVRSTSVVAYSEPGTYEPAVKVWSYGDDGETSDVATCGTVSVTESTPTPTPTPESGPAQAGTSTSTATSTPVATSTTDSNEPDGSGGSTPTPTPGTAPDGEPWFRYSPDDPSANDSVRLVADPAMARDDVETHGWDLDRDGTVDRRGRVIELPANTSGETTVTLLVEGVDGSTTSVTRRVPVTLGLADETEASQRPATGTGGDIPVAVLLGLLLLVLAVAVVVARSRMGG